MLASFALALPLARPAHAEPSDRRPWWQSPSIQSSIELTPEQVGRLDAIHRESLPERRRLREQLTCLQNLLGRVLDEGRSDDDHGRLIIERVFEAQKQRNIARTLMLLRMYRVLNPGQREKLARLSAAGGAGVQ
jgi:Spy/CpxP family protein refolding chaperone